MGNGYRPPNTRRQESSLAGPRPDPTIRFDTASLHALRPLAHTTAAVKSRQGYIAPSMHDPISARSENVSKTVGFCIAAKLRLFLACITSEQMPPCKVATRRPLTR